MSALLIWAVERRTCTVRVRISSGQVHPSHARRGGAPERVYRPSSFSREAGKALARGLDSSFCIVMADGEVDFAERWRAGVALDVLCAAFVLRVGRVLRARRICPGRQD